MHHQACQRSTGYGSVKSDYDVRSRLSLVRAEIERIEHEFASLMSASMREARDVIHARAERTKFFSAGLFSDPAWDILLELYACSATQRSVSVTKLMFAIEVPQTTGLRWLATLEREGLVLRTADSADKRRTWAGLTDLGLQKMEAYFADILPR